VADVPFGSLYLLGAVIGRGAQGQVFRARVRDGTPDVAVKMLRDDLVANPEVVARFVQERHVLQAVHHPNVVQVRDLVHEQDRLGIVMDLVEDGDLRALQCRDAAEATELCARIADGLEAVHTAGVIHRDLKPANVLLERDDHGDRQPRLTDFGIARLIGHHLTRTSKVLGTPLYLAPEVIRGEQPTSAVDIYALGVILYELCTGQAPFDGDSEFAVMHAHVQQPPPRPEQMPDSLWALLSSLLDKDPTRRPAAATTASRLRELTPDLAGLGPFAVAGSLLEADELGPRADDGERATRAGDAREDAAVSPAARPDAEPSGDDRRRHRALLLVAVPAVLLLLLAGSALALNRRGADQADASTVAAGPGAVPTGEPSAGATTSTSPEGSAPGGEPAGADEGAPADAATPTAPGGGAGPGVTGVVAGGSPVAGGGATPPVGNSPAGPGGNASPAPGGGGPTPTAAPRLPPTITVQPGSHNVQVRDATTLTSAATGNGLIRYQWYRNGAAVGGATGTSLRTPELEWADNGAQYWVLATDDNGTTRSTTATVTVTNRSYDINRNGAVDCGDFTIMKDNFGTDGFKNADLNGDHIINLLDFSLWATTSPPGCT
jgi:serine/threonine protein kinase, bacterial